MIAAVVTPEQVQRTAPPELLRILLPIRQQGGLPRHRGVRYLIYKRTLTDSRAASGSTRRMVLVSGSGLGSRLSQDQGRLLGRSDCESEIGQESASASSR